MVALDPLHFGFCCDCSPGGSKRGEWWKVSGQIPFTLRAAKTRRTIPHRIWSDRPPRTNHSCLFLLRGTSSIVKMGENKLTGYKVAVKVSAVQPLSPPAWQISSRSDSIGVECESMHLDRGRVLPRHLTSAPGSCRSHLPALIYPADQQILGTVYNPELRKALQAELKFLMPKLQGERERNKREMKVVGWYGA